MYFAVFAKYILANGFVNGDVAFEVILFTHTEFWARFATQRAR